MVILVLVTLVVSKNNLSMLESGRGAVTRVSHAHVCVVVYMLVVN